MGKSKLPWDARAAEVLAGKLKLDAAPLIGLVNEVNPTGRGRDTRESAARYALKARLESLLVERFADSIEVVADPQHPGIVSLRHRLHPDVACHAVIVALEDDARSWVQRALDLGKDEEPAHTPAARSNAAEPEEDPDDPDEMLRAAARAEAEYDFEAAERLLRRAYRERPDAPSAQALLRLLVDVLAADADALALEEGLPAAARGSSAVRVLLGLAAARGGEEARATRLVLPVDDPRAAETFVLLARAALTRADADVAAQRLADASRVDPAHPDLRSLGDDLAKLREGQRAPLEAELAALLTGGRDAEARAMAESILARWPDSEAARRAAKTLETRRRAEEGERLLAEAATAQNAGELATARTLLQRAIGASGADATRARAERSLAEVEQKLRERDLDAAVARVTAALRPKQRPDPAALLEYAELDETARARVIAACPEDASLAWIDTMRRSGAKATRPVVDAAVALGAAAACLQTDPAKALATLASHERLLESVPFADDVGARARTKLADGRRDKALADLGAAEAALSTGDAENAGKLLERALRDLPEETSGRLDALRARLAVEGKRRELGLRLARARATTNFHEARRAFAALEAAAEPSLREAWRAQATAYDEETRKWLGLRVENLDAGLSLCRGNYFHEYPAQVVAAIDLEARTLVLPNSAARTLFVRTYALDTGRLTRIIELTAPDDFYEPKTVLSGDRVLCSGGGSGMIELSSATGDVLRWSMLREANRPNRRLMDVVQPVPGGRYLWVHFDEDMAEGGVYDLEGERPYRSIAGFDGFHLLPGVEPTRIGVERNDSVLSLHDPGGNQTARYDFPSYVRGVVQHPRADRLVVVFNRDAGYPNPHDLLWQEVLPSGERGVTGALSDYQPFAGLSMAAARTSGLIFIRYRATDERSCWLVALGGEPLTLQYKVALGQRRVLIQDVKAERVFVVGEGEDGLDIQELGPEPPELSDLGPKPPFVSPLQSLWACTERSGSVSSQFFLNHFKWRPVDEIRQRALALQAEREGNKDALLELFGGLAVSNDAVGASDLGAYLEQTWPDDPEMVQARWAGLVVQRKWQELVDLLEPLDPTTLADADRQHRHHLLSAAYFALGDIGRGQQHIEDARVIEGKCKLPALDAMNEATREPLPGLEVPRGGPPVREVLALTVAADTLLAEGDHAGVVRLLDRRATFEHREAQLLSRLVVARLALEAHGAEESWCKRFAFATFIDALDETRVGFRNESLVPGATWPEERLQELATQCRAWLASS